MSSGSVQFTRRGQSVTRRFRRAWGWAAAALSGGVAAGGYWWSGRAVEEAHTADRDARWRAAIAAASDTPRPRVGPGAAATASASITGPEVEPPAVDGAKLRADVEALGFVRFEPGDRARARALLVERLQVAGLVPRERPFATGVNLEAERPGTEAAAGTLLVAAHYDTVEGSPGADDNASGVATLLAVARHFTTPRRRGLRLVFFDQEEQGLLGSRAYAADDERIAGLVGVVSLEMVGFACHTEGCQHFPAALPVRPPTTRGDFLAVVGSAEHLPLFTAFVRGTVGPPVLALPVPDRGVALPDARRSDHAPFWDRGLGAVMVTDTADLRSPYYHTGLDVPATLDAAFHEGATRRVLVAVERLLADPDLRPSPATAFAPGLSPRPATGTRDGAPPTAPGSSP